MNPSMADRQKILNYFLPLVARRDDVRRHLNIDVETVIVPLDALPDLPEVSHVFGLRVVRADVSEPMLGLSVYRG